MKNIFILLACVAVIATGCKKEKKDDNTGGKDNNGGAKELSVKEVQRGMVGYVGATWCGPCGSSGGPGFKKMMEKFTDDQMISFYLSSASNSATTAVSHKDRSTDKFQIAKFVPQIYTAMRSKGTIPFFNVNGANVGGAYTDANYTATKYGKNITSITGQTPKIGVGATKTLSSNKLVCNVKVKAFDDYAGELYYSVLALEKSVVGLQKVGATNVFDYTHKNIVRASLVGDGTMEGQQAWDQVSPTSLKKGEEHTKTFTLNYVDPQVDIKNWVVWDYKPATTVVVVSVWKKNGSNYDFVNSVVAE